LTIPDLLLAAAPFAAGAAVASLAWWVYGRYLDPPPAASPARSDVPVVGPRGAPPRLNPRTGLLRTSQRVVLHIAGQPRLAYGDVAGAELTQAGMSRALSIAQPALARVLARLVDGDAVLVMRTHVKGGSQRLKVYQLTAHGEAIARDLRGRIRRLPPERAPAGAETPKVVRMEAPAPVESMLGTDPAVRR
jgi:DNA-binding MarR family transcriptional regulator